MFPKHHPSFCLQYESKRHWYSWVMVPICITFTTIFFLPCLEFKDASVFDILGWRPPRVCWKDERNLHSCKASCHPDPWYTFTSHLTEEHRLVTSSLEKSEIVNRFNVHMWLQMFTYIVAYISTHSINSRRSTNIFSW